MTLIPNRRPTQQQTLDMLSLFPLPFVLPHHYFYCDSGLGCPTFDPIVRNYYETSHKLWTHPYLPLRCLQVFTCLGSEVPNSNLSQYGLASAWLILKMLLWRWSIMGMHSSWPYTNNNMFVPEGSGQFYLNSFPIYTQTSNLTLKNEVKRM